MRKHAQLLVGLIFAFGIVWVPLTANAQQSRTRLASACLEAILRLHHSTTIFGKVCVNWDILKEKTS